MGIQRHRRTEIIRSSFVLNSTNLGRRVVSGAGYTFLGIALRTLLTIGSMSILARLLTPSDFGYIAMATVVTELAGLFGGFGFTNVLIQRQVINRLQLDTVFWASATVGVVLTLAVFSLSFLAGWLFKDPLTGELLRVMCVIFLIGGLTSIPQAVLARLMLFRLEFSIQIFALTIRGLTAVVFAYFGYGVWSLVAGALAGAIVEFICYLIAIPYVPRFRFHGGFLSSTWKTSGSYFSGGFLYYISMNIDILLIGRSLGANALGYYQNARSLTDEVRARIAMPLQRVLFPAFSAIQGDRERLQQTVIRSGRILASIIIPVGIGISAIAEELVPILYGSQWLTMIPILSLFGLSAALKGSTAIASPLFYSQNRVGLALKYHFIGTTLLVLGVILTLPYGVVAVTFAVSISSLYQVVIFRVGLGLIGLNVRHAFEVLGYPTLAATVMWVAITATRPFSTVWTSNAGLLLLIHVGLGALAYTLTLHSLSRQYLRDFSVLARQLLSKS